MPEELPVVAVRGEGRLEVEPEIARVSVAVTARDPDRGRTMELVAARQRAVREVLDGFADALDDVETSHVHVAPRYPKGGQDAAPIGYQAEVWYTVTVADPDRAGDLLARLAEVDSARVEGPSWALHPSSAAYGRAREAAIADALARAGDYATALGSRLVGLLELADAGGGPGRYEPELMEFATRSSGGAPSFDIESGRQLVEATVEARFTMTAPTLPPPPQH